MYATYMDVKVTPHDGAQRGLKGGEEKVWTQGLFREDTLWSSFWGSYQAPKSRIPAAYTPETTLQS